MNNSIPNTRDANGAFLKMVAVALGDELQGPRLMYRGVSALFGKQNEQGYKPGDEVFLERPVRGIVKSGLDSTDTDFSLNPQKMSVTIRRTAHTAFSWDAIERTLKITDDKTRYATQYSYAKQFAIDIASKVNQEALAFMGQNAMHSVGTPGTAPTSETSYLNARDLIFASGLPRNEKLRLITNARNSSAFVTGTKGLNNPGGIISKQWVSGDQQAALGLEEVVYDELLATKTIATYSGSTVVSTADQTGTEGDNGTMNLAVAGFGATETITAGTRFTIGSAASATVNGVRRVYPRGGDEASGRMDTGYQQIFTTQTDVTMSGGAGTLVVSPAITTSGPYQNMVAAPVASAIITIQGTSGTTGAKQMILMNKMAFGFVSLPLSKDGDGKGAEIINVTDPDTDISLQMTQFHDGNKSITKTKIAVLYDFATLYRELAAVVWGA